MPTAVYRLALVGVVLCLACRPVLAAAETPSPAAAAGSGAIVLPRATVDLPQAWERQTPSSKMRAAQAVIPGPAGPGELTVFYFGEGKGGGVDANIQRWLGQMELPPGSAPARASFETKGFTVTWIDVAGTLKASTMGMGPMSPQPHTRMLAAVIEGPGGPWFFRAVGPEQTMSPQRDAFLGMLKSVRSS
jgi:hypothetical protein